MGFDTSRLTASKPLRKGVCVIDKVIEKPAEAEKKPAPARQRSVRGKTRIIVKEHFLQQGKTMEELLTDVLLEKAKQTTA